MCIRDSCCTVRNEHWTERDAVCGRMHGERGTPSDRRAGAFKRSLEGTSGITLFEKLHMVIREVVRCLQRYRPFRMLLHK